jgi:hypothetical protein
LPAFDYPERKFTLAEANAPAGLGPHFEQGLVATEQLALRDLTDFRTRPLFRAIFNSAINGAISFFSVIMAHPLPFLSINRCTNQIPQCSPSQKNKKNLCDARAHQRSD